MTGTSRLVLTAASPVSTWRFFVCDRHVDLSRVHAHSILGGDERVRSAWHRIGPVRATPVLPEALAEEHGWATIFRVSAPTDETRPVARSCQPRFWSTPPRNLMHTPRATLRTSSSIGRSGPVLPPGRTRRGDPSDDPPLQHGSAPLRAQDDAVRVRGE
jgi:hypothetical protein